ncbi:MAG: hypothetical protein QNJ13_15295 [Paracoccaceae bacterium]|nr:hypothetical protein [Paracoccaceae bacterium]
MADRKDIADLDGFVARVRAGDSGAALGLMRAVRTGELSRIAEVRVVDALYDNRRAFRSKRLHFALALMCARTGARARGRAILLELVALDYPPAMHCLGCELFEAGRAEAGLQLLRLARSSGYRLGDAAYWRYQASMARGPRRFWLLVRAAVARLPRRKPPTQRAAERDVAFWLPE